jgi:hypothetical protein
MHASIRHTEPAANEPKPPVASDAPGSTVRIAFTGDVCLGSGLFDTHPGRTAASLLARLPPLFAGADLVVGNLEFAVAPHAGWRSVRRGAIGVAPHLLEGLGKSGFHVFSLANNHVMDAGVAGLRALRTLLQQEGLECVGAGESRAEASRPLLLDVKGRRVALLSACDWSPNFARRDAAGIAPLRVRALQHQVAELRAACDLVVVLLHADLEFSAHPAPWRQRLARTLADSGAHAVVQHHPHVVQGWERWGAGVIAYSLGNFVFRIDGNPYQGHQPGTRDGVVLHLEVQFKSGESAPQLVPRFAPVRIGADHLPALPAPSHAACMLDMLARLSAELREPQAVRAAWRRRSTAETRRLAYGMYVDAMRGRLAPALWAPWRALLHPEDRRWLWGCLTAGYR